VNGPHAAHTIRPTRLIRAICLVGMCFYAQAAGQPGLFWMSQRLVHVGMDTRSPNGQTIPDA
jgi:hypothetical protein